MTNKNRMKKRVLVTGGSGKLGQACVKHLIETNYDVLVVDKVKFPDKNVPTLITDLTDFGQTLEAMQSVNWENYIAHKNGAFDAVVHLAAIPGPAVTTPAEAFRINILSTYNVFDAAQRCGINNIVWASSETLLGLPLETANIPYIPADENFPWHSRTAYSLSKVLGEEMANQFCLNHPEMKITCLRFSNVMTEDEYAYFPDFDKHPETRAWNLWGYIDARDGAQAVQKAIEWNSVGMDTFIIANEDTVSGIPSLELAARYFPGVPINKELSQYETMLSIEKAKRILGYQPQYSWRNYQS
jgi:nucleoside-diphosphate-sugar epimerase